jgi:glycosyltransferase involved in cell wall biosynthesis
MSSSNQQSSHTAHAGADRSRPDVAVFIPSYAGGGAERVAFFVAMALTEAGFHVDLVVACDEGALRSELLPGVNAVHLGAPNELFSAPAWIRYLRDARPRCAISMVHTANFNSGIGAYLVPEVPVVVGLHYALQCEPESQWWIRRWFGFGPERFLYKRAARVLGVSRGLAEEAVEVFDLPSDKARAIYNPRQRDRSVGTIAPEHEPIFAKPVVVSAGRLVPQKDYANLLRAFAMVARGKDVHLLILGEGPERERLERQAFKLGIADRVFMPGFVDNPTAYMQRSSVFALSSRNEGFGLVLIEAIEARIGIVSTDCHWGPSEVLDRGRFGRLVSISDSDALAEAIALELDHPSFDYETRADECAEWLRQFEPEAIAAQYVALVREVIANG